MFSRENLNKITEIFRSAGVEQWPRLCKELNIRKGTPKNVIVDWIYGSKPTADHYKYEARPYHDPDKNVVVFESPWPGPLEVLKQMNDPEYPVFGGYLEIDSEVAAKILVLGLP